MSIFCTRGVVGVVCETAGEAKGDGEKWGQVLTFNFISLGLVVWRGTYVSRWRTVCII